MKDHIFELRRKILRHDWSSQWHTQQINKFKKMNEWMPEKKKKNNSGLNGIRTQPMTSAIQMQCSSNWAIKPSGTWFTLWLRNITVEGEECKWIYERSYIWTAGERYVSLSYIIYHYHPIISFSPTHIFVCILRVFFR